MPPLPVIDPEGIGFTTLPQDMHPYDPYKDGILPHLSVDVAHAFGNILAFLAKRKAWRTFTAEELLEFTIPSGRNLGDYDSPTLHNFLCGFVDLDLLALVDTESGRFAVTTEFVGLALLGRGVRKIICASKLLLPIPEHRVSHFLSTHGCTVKHGCVMLTVPKG